VVSLEEKAVALFLFGYARTRLRVAHQLQRLLGQQESFRGNYQAWQIATQARSDYRHRRPCRMSG
jgi:hypothetical protein